MPTTTGMLWDLGAFGRHARLRWRKRVWRCREQACTAATWTERIGAVGGRQSMTERARENACERVGRDGDWVAAKDYARPLLDDPARLP